MDNETAKFTFTYKMDKEGFTKLNLLLQEKLLSKSRKKTIRLGYLQLFIAGAYVVTMVVTGHPLNTFVMIIALLVLFTGLYSVLYFPLFFKKKLQKAIDETFANSEYLQNEITFKFFDTYCEETNYSDVRTMEYAKMNEVVEQDNYVMMLVDRSGVCFPKSAMGGREEEFVSFLKERVGTK